MEISVDDILSQRRCNAFEYRQSTYCPCYGEEGICCVSRRGIQKYLGKGMSCYVPRKTYSPKESIEMIKMQAVWRFWHTLFILRKITTNCIHFLKQLKEYGLDGTECLYNCYSEEFSKCVLIYAIN